MSNPKPGSWIKPESTPSPSSTPKTSHKGSRRTSESETPAPTSATKKPFELKPNLTTRPLKGHEGLAELRKALSPKKPVSKKPARRRPTSHKNTKENN